MSGSPFDDADGRFCVLVNDEQQHRTGLRPQSLRDARDAGPVAAGAA